jgi:hypothetical protein
LHAGQLGRGGLTVRLTGAYRARVIGHAHDAVTPAAYAKETEAAPDHYLHLRATGARRDGEVAEGLWRMSLETIDGWTLRATADAEVDKRPFARLLGTP